MSEPPVAPQRNGATDSLFESNFSAADATTSGATQGVADSLTLRALVTSKEAGVIIGKAGNNVAEIRESTGVKAGVSKPVPGVQERVLTISGTLDGVAKAYSSAAITLVDSPPAGNYVHSLSPPPPPGIATIRLLISHQQMGTVIGRQGLKIKTIQESAKVRMVASKEMLPQSTERIVEIQGTPEAVYNAILEIGKCLLDDSERAVGSIPYNPQNATMASFRSSPLSNLVSRNNGLMRQIRSSHHNSVEENKNEAYQEIAISADMVGCIIGKGGAKIQEIRQMSGAKISIARQPRDASGDRLFTIKGTPQASERALSLLYEQLEQEKHRRSED